MSKILAIIFILSFGQSYADELPEYLSSPNFEYTGTHEDRDQCISDELKSQISYFSNKDLFIADLSPNTSGDRFEYMKYFFCTVDEEGRCAEPFNIFLSTSDEDGWEMDWNASSFSNFFVKSIDMARVVEIKKRNENEVFETLNIYNCREHFNAE